MYQVSPFWEGVQSSVRGETSSLNFVSPVGKAGLFCSPLPSLLFPFEISQYFMWLYVDLVNHLNVQPCDLMSMQASCWWCGSVVEPSLIVFKTLN